jgi:uncharacterized protein YjbI with pentapeptide repeats
MGRIVELPSLKPRSTSRRQGLRKLSPDLISKARDETATQVTRIGLTFLGTAAFCLLSLLSPDSALLGGSERINVPFAGPVSFFGFMLLGPAVLIVLRVYLQIYVEHSERLDRLARSVFVVRAPTLVPLQNPLIRLFSSLIFYLLLPLAMMLFAWKAAVFPAWGSGLLSVAVAVIASHFMLPFSRLSWRQIGLLSVSAAIIGLTSRTAAVIAEATKDPSILPSAPLLDLGPAWGWALLSLALAGIAVRGMLPFSRFSWRQIGLVSVSAAILAGWAMLVFGPLLHRPFDLYHANLSGHWLANEELPNAYLRFANLSGANLSRAYLWRADLIAANLSGANLSRVDLSAANLIGANLSRANLMNRANLDYANLSGADLSDAHLLQARLDHANLSSANLSNADLIGAKLSTADLSGANLSDAKLSTADLSGANLSNADLSGADLSDVHLPTRLRDANLSGGAKLRNADLIGAKLRNANLSNADLSGTKNLTQTQLDEACGTNTKLPEGLRIKPCSTD